MLDSLISPALWITYILFFLALGVCVIMPAFQAIKHPADLFKSLIGIVALLVLFGISYALSGSEVSSKAASLGVDASSSKLIGAGIIMFYIVLLVSIVLVVYSLIRDIVNN